MEHVKLLKLNTIWYKFPDELPNENLLGDVPVNI